MRAAPALLDRIEAAGIGLTDLGREATDEVVILKSAREGLWDGGEWIEYEDTETTRRYRDEMRRINRWLEQADIKFDADACEDRIIDDTDRRLRRYFNNGVFDQGGRLFGGFWLNLSRQERREGITINGESIVTLDYSQMAPRIIYGMVGVDPSDGDAYTLPFFERHRSGVKKVFNALLYSTKPLERLPQGSKALLPRNTKIGEIVTRLEARHPAIKHRFCAGIGYRGMFVESTILIGTLLDLIERGIVALPVHDALIVPQSAASVVTSVMLEVFQSITGCPLYFSFWTREIALVEYHVAPRLPSLIKTDEDPSHPSSSRVSTLRSGQILASCRQYSSLAEAAISFSCPCTARVSHDRAALDRSASDAACGDQDPSGAIANALYADWLRNPPRPRGWAGDTKFHE
jgi:hypothetical protein